MYVINKTDGSIVATVNDGVADRTFTDLVLVGKSYAAYGEVINENFVKLMENFSLSTPPTKPIKGQLWYNANASVEKIQVHHDSTVGFKLLNVVNVSATTPDNPVKGDLWYDSGTRQLKFYDELSITGNTWVVLGPSYTSSQGKSGQEIATVSDGVASHVITKLYDGGDLIAVLSKDAFYPDPSIGAGFSSIARGLTLSSDAIINGTVENANRLDGLLAAQFLRSDVDTVGLGTLKVKNDLGLYVGFDDNFHVEADAGGVTLTSMIPDTALNFNIHDASNANLTALTIDNIGDATFNYDVYLENLIANADIQGNANAIINGNLDVVTDLTVIGLTTFSNLAVSANVDVADTLTANVLTSNILVDANAIVANVVSINTVFEDESLNVEGNIRLGGADSIKFIGTGNATVRADQGNLIIATGGMDRITSDDNGDVLFTGGIYGPYASMDYADISDVNIINNVISASLPGDDLRLESPDGVVSVNELESDSYVTSPLVDVTSTNDSASKVTGALTVAGGVGIGKNLHVGGQTIFHDDIHMQGVFERVSIEVTIPSGLVDIYTKEGASYFFINGDAGNWGAAITYSETQELNDVMDVGESIAVCFLVKHGAAPHIFYELKIDGVFQDIFWMGYVPDAGNANMIDAYNFLIIKTGDYTWQILGSLVNFTSVA